MYSYKKIGAVSTPIILGLLVQNVIQITDTIFMSRVGEVEFGAVGLAGIYYIAFFMLAFGFSIGCQIVISRRNGEQNFYAIGNVVIHSIVFLLSLAVILYLASLFAVKHVLPQVISSAEVYSATKAYLDWRTLGFFFSFVNVVFRAFYVGITQTKVLTINAIVMAVVNFFMSFGLIFGYFGMPAMGIEGAAISSVIAEISSVIFFLIYTYASINLKKYGFVFGKLRFSVVKQVLNISIFSMLQYTASLSLWFIFFLAIENHGERALAITNVIRTLYTIYFIPINALSTTANTLVSNSIGAGQASQVHRLANKIVGLGVAVVLFMGAVTMINPQWWISLIVSNNDISLIVESVPALYVVLLAVPICAAGCIYFNSVSGTGNTQVGLLMEIVALGAYIFALWLIVIRWRASVALCWSVEIIYWGALLLLAYSYLRWGNWQKKSV